MKCNIECKGTKIVGKKKGKGKKVYLMPIILIMPEIPIINFASGKLENEEMRE